MERGAHLRRGRCPSAEHIAAGGVVSFGDMEETVEYSKDLVRRFFRD